jgi:protein-S-isoprenylcysteine O-methyltransferase Ste14
MDIFKVSAATLVLLATAFLIFRHVGSDYLTHGKLTPFSSFLETLIFFLHGAGSYFFLDSDLSHSDRSSPTFVLAVLCIAVGLPFVFIAMTRLGMGQSLGSQVRGLQSTGLYRYTRNPQIVAYGLVVIGYALLWPSWSGLVWVMIYMAIAHWMVRTEEEHLRRVYGEAYERYCARTPRYIGLPQPYPRDQ